MKMLSTQEIGTMISERFFAGDAVGNDQDLMLSGKIDSLGVAILIAELEAMRGAPIPPQDVTLENFATVSAIAAYLNDAE